MQQHRALVHHHTLAELHDAVTTTREPFQRTRLKAIFLRAQDKTPQEIAQQLLVSDRSVTEWILRYNKGGIPELRTKQSGRPEGNPIWDQSLFNELAQEVDKGGYWSIPRMQEWLKKHKQVDIPEQTIWYRMDQLKYSYKSSRPSPIGGDAEKRATFKKGASLRFWSR